MKLCFSSSEAWSEENHVPQENGGSIELATDYVKPTDSRTVNGMKKQKIQQNEIQYHQNVKMVKRETLEDLILASPTRKEKCVRTDAATIQRSFVIRFFKRICPPFTDDYGVTNVSRFNVHNGSMESVVNVKVVDHIGRTNDAPLSRCKSRNINKKVSFRVPSEDDIIIFYDSNEESEN
ncbi:hypothetical protein CsatB_014483 [Cannabis sativa]